MQSAKIIKIFGLPRSCTNLTTVALRTNLKCIVLDNYPCWKHGFNDHRGRSLKNKDYETNDLKFVICTKNPLDWLWSLFCFENETKLKNKKTKEQFLNNFSWHYKNMTPIEAYNKLNFHWLKMCATKHIYQMKIENLEKNQINEIQKIQKYFNLEAKNESFFEVENTVKPGCKISDVKFEKRNQTWTLAEKNFIYKKIEKKTLELCGYFFFKKN